MKTNKLYTIKIYSLLLFVFSLPFEYWDPFGISSFFTVTKFAGFLYFLLSLTDLKNNFTLKFVKKPITLLLSLWLLLLLQAIFNYWYGTTLSVYNLTFLQNIILFLLISNDLIKNKNLVKSLFLVLIIGVFLMSTLSSFGIGLNSEIDSEVGSYRLTFFGSNSNGVGNLAAISLLFVLSMILDKDRFYGRKTYFLILTIPSLISILSLSGSRGALVISFVGILVLFLFQKVSFFKKLLIVFVGSAFLVFTITRILESEIMQRRINLTTSEGSLGGREEIWKNALDIFYENPFLGKGNTGYQYEMIQRNGLYMDTHNIFLYFMVTGGTLALFLYCLFLYNLLKASKNYYKYSNSIVLFALLIVYIFAVFKSGGAINSKLYWLITAIIYGIGSSIINIKKA